MANTSVVYARIDARLKNNAEEILTKLGISPSAAVQMLYSQIILQNGLPFDLKLPAAKPAAVGGMTQKELGDELSKGVESLKSGRALTAAEFDAELAEEFGI